MLEMIMKAIEALGENGGDELAISNVLKNNYMKLDPNASPKRGHGRPPKAKVLLPSSIVLSPPRPRGRSPKDPNAPLKSPSATKCQSVKWKW
ncbi:HMG-Y-related protein A [Spatholobus suberectus]|nr:HMG-Y-related protein A [Spatholobus suberectus]